MRVRSGGLGLLFICLSLSTPWPMAAQPSAGANLGEVAAAFATPPDDARVMMRWWWFGPSVTREGIERELTVMRAGGLGGVEIQPVYPLALDGTSGLPPILPFLSTPFLDSLGFAARTARRLGLRVDVTLGSGWPYGGPGVTIEEAAGRLRVERLSLTAGSRRVPLPPLAGGERLIAVFSARLDGEVLADAPFRRVTDLRDGAAWLSREPAPDEALLVFVASRTGMQVKRAAVGAEGFVLDHYSRAALDAYLREVGAPLLDAFGAAPPDAIFCDSLEVFSSNWTDGFAVEFERRRGYDLVPRLPELVLGAGPAAADLRHDWSRTLTELYDERFLQPLAAWAAARGTRLRIQNYGIPPATLGTHAHVALPEGEGWRWRRLTASRWAASASHLYGRPVASSETWTWLHSPTFRATPLDLKAEADLHFLQGITQLIGHGWPYTPEGVEYPGWRFYAAGAFNDANPWWIVMPDLAGYLQRVSFALRQGSPANDVAFYLPTADAWTVFGGGRARYMLDALAERIGPSAIGAVLDAGFNLDFFDDATLDRVGRFDGEGLTLGGLPYRIVVLPNVERMPLQTLRTLERFARSGGVLVAVGRLPERAPGALAGAEAQAEVREIAGRLFGAGGPGHLVRDDGEELTRTLRSATTPDVRVSAPASGIGFVHRRLDGGDVFFVANTLNRRQRFDATFRVTGAGADWWDPMTGDIARATVRTGPDGIAVAFDLEPYGSRLLAFGTSAGSPAARGSATRDEIVDLSGEWQVTFPGTRPQTWTALRPWTDDERTRYFSGVVRYEKSVALPDGFLAGGRRVWLDLGEAQPVTPDTGPNTPFRAWVDAPVREAAVVYVNDIRAGSVWAPPYTVDVTRQLRGARATIRLDVANLALNHMAGRALPDFALLNLRYGMRFENQDQDKVRPIPAGLLGPVRLVARAGDAAAP